MKVFHGNSKNGKPIFTKGAPATKKAGSPPVKGNPETADQILKRLEIEKAEGRLRDDDYQRKSGNAVITDHTARQRDQRLVLESKADKPMTPHEEYRELMKTSPLAACRYWEEHRHEIYKMMSK